MLILSVGGKIDMTEEKKPGKDNVLSLPVIPLLPSGVYDTGEIARHVSEADLAENPPAAEENAAEENPKEAS
jgi:hypothetical protein